MDSSKGPVSRAEVHDGGPVIAKVVGEGAGGAGRGGGWVVAGGRVHGDVEGVAADDLVEVRGGGRAGVDEWVETLDDQLRALEAHHGHLALGEDADALEEEGGGEGFPVHFCCGRCTDGWVVREWM